MSMKSFFSSLSSWLSSSSSSLSSLIVETISNNILLSTITSGVVIIGTNWFLYFNYKVNQFDQTITDWNNTEWRIEGLARPCYIIRYINVGAFGNSSTFGNFILYLLKKYSITPALDKSIQLMKDADEDNDLNGSNIPKILCNEQARNDMTVRIENYYLDIVETTHLTIVGKILNYYQSSIDLTNHYGILKMAMSSSEISKEQIINPVFIVSLPRTGTTILHRTMSKDTKRYKCFDMCDMVLPLPTLIPRWDSIGRANKAIELQTTIIQKVNYLYPNFFKCMSTMHEFIPSEADESLNWYDSCLGHHYMDSMVKLYPMYRNTTGKSSSKSNSRYPNGIAELIESNHTAVYRYEWLKLIMKLYQYTDKVEWKNRGYNLDENGNDTIECPTNNIPWLLKDPDHSAYLPQLIQVFNTNITSKESSKSNSLKCDSNGLKLIFSHRNPTDIIASMTKLFFIFCMMDAIPNTPGTSAKEWGIEDNRRIQRYINGMINFTKYQDTTNDNVTNNGTNNNGTNNNSYSITNKRENDNDTDNEEDDNEEDDDDDDNGTIRTTTRPRRRSKNDPFRFQFVRNNGDNNNDNNTIPLPLLPKNRIDFHFLDLVTNIPGAIETIYQQFGYGDTKTTTTTTTTTPIITTTEARTAFQLYLKQNPRDKHGNQKHRLLSQLYLTENDIQNQEYNKLFLNNKI